MSAAPELVLETVAPEGVRFELTCRCLRALRYWLEYPEVIALEQGLAPREAFSAEAATPALAQPETAVASPGAWDVGVAEMRCQDRCRCGSPIPLTLRRFEPTCWLDRACARGYLQRDTRRRIRQHCASLRGA